MSEAGKEGPVSLVSPKGSASAPAQAVHEAAKAAPTPSSLMQCRVLVPVFTLRGQAYRAGGVVELTADELAEHAESVCRLGDYEKRGKEEAARQAKVAEDLKAAAKKQREETEQKDAKIAAEAASAK